jgi:hypothetical protein
MYDQGLPWRPLGEHSALKGSSLQEKKICSKRMRLSPGVTMKPRHTCFDKLEHFSNENNYLQYCEQF